MMSRLKELFKGRLFNSISNANVKSHKEATYQDLIDGMNAIG